MTDAQEPPRKRRNRSTLVCNVCKQRKVKCDRKSPCTRCIVYKTQDICSYTEEVPAIDQKQQQKLQFQPPPVSKIHNDSSKPSQPPIPSVNPQQHIQFTSPDNIPHNFLSKGSSTHVFIITSEISHILGKFTNAESVVGINPINSPNEVFNFFNYSSFTERSDKQQLNHGPFSWHAFLDKDVALADLWTYLSDKSNELRRISKATSNSPGSTQPDEDQGTGGVIGHDDLGDILAKIPFQVLQRLNLSNFKFDASKRRINQTAIPLGMNFTTNQDYFNDNSIDLKEKILKILPSREVIWIHINRFFKFLYPFIPIIDETSFKKDIERVISGDSEYITNIHIHDNLDYANIGMLLIILRMSFLSLISNNEEFNNMVLKSATCPKVYETHFTPRELRNLQLLLKNSIGIEFIELARNCITKFQLFQKTNLVILQFTLLMRLYFYFSPEDSEGPDRNQFQIYNGTLIQMGYTIGLNRDPSILGKFDLKTSNIRRKVWHFLVYLDLFQAAQYGSPISTNPQYCDTKFPYYEPGNANIGFEHFDKFLQTTYGSIQDLTKHLRNLLVLILDVNSQLKMSDFTEKLSALEIYMAKNLGSSLKVFADSLNQIDDTESDLLPKVFYIPYYLQTKTFLSAIYFHLFLHFEKENSLDLAFFYIKKCICILLEDFLPQCFRILDHQHYFFCHSTNFFINPNIECCLHNTNGFLFAIIIRLEYSMRIMKQQILTEDNKKYINSCETLIYWLTKCAKISTVGISKLGKRYLYAWRISKSHTFILKSLASEDYFKKLNDPIESAKFAANNPRLTNFNLKLWQINELSEILQNTIMSLNKSQLINEWIELFGPIPESKPKSLSPENKITPTPNIDPLITDPFIGNLDNLFNQVTSRIDPAVFENDVLPQSTNSVITSTMENYLALDNPYFDIFNDLSLDQLIKSFDQ
ncbi:Multidrug resistance regulator 1 [Spathaspora sp. JA1]|nr:Multidrug resistance regulator 1 [Spathaspora sp. JA1]